MVRVKICGITCVADAVSTAESGADAIGLVFYAKSPRYIADLALARDIAYAVGPLVTVVGLFVNPVVSDVERVLSAVPLGLLQFHGDEEDTFCQSFNRPYIKAVRMKPDLDVQMQMAKFPSSSGILLDAYSPGVPGGTGETFDWHRVPKKTAKPLVLAGGLTPENVERAVACTQPYAVDVSGGVELSPGLKSADLVNRFIKNAKNIDFSA